MFPYTLIRSQRKTVGIYITKEAALEVRAPLLMAKADIDKFVATKEQWITTHLAKREQHNKEKAAFKLEYGGSVLLCGKQYPLAAQESNRAGFDGLRFYIPPNLPPDKIKFLVMQIYQTLAKKLLVYRADEYAKIMKLKAAAIKINSAKTRWGSCSPKNSICFSWRLIMCDDEVIDYVVVHELAHIKEHNHSERFWRLVEGVLPDYQNRRQRLKQFQEKLAVENWD